MGYDYTKKLQAVGQVDTMSCWNFAMRFCRSTPSEVEACSSIPDIPSALRVKLEKYSGAFAPAPRLAASLVSRVAA